MSSLSEPNKKRHCSGTDADASTNLEIHSLLKSFKDDIVSEVSGQKLTLNLILRNILNLSLNC